jgi:hypothetical protein
MTRSMLLIWLSLMWMAVVAMLTGAFVVLFQEAHQEPKARAMVAAKVADEPVVLPVSKDGTDQ